MVRTLVNVTMYAQHNNEKERKKKTIEVSSGA
jgi:hypothetical protein